MNRLITKSIQQLVLLLEVVLNWSHGRKGFLAKGWMIGLIAIVTMVVGLMMVRGIAADQPDQDGTPQSKAKSPAVTVPLLIGYQGRLADPGTGEAKPDGDYFVIFSLYDVETGGTALWSESQTVSVKNGVFSAHLGDSTPLSISHFNGQALWLGIKVESDAEATPRHALAVVPYALGLRPGAKIEGMGAILTGVTTGSSGNDRGLFGQATATGGSPTGVRGETASVDSNSVGVYGLATSTSATGSGVKGQNNGTAGYGVWGQGGGNAIGVLGQTSSATAYGVWAYNSGTGVALRAEGGGNLIEAWSLSPVNARFRVDNSGNVRADGGFTTPAADFAEMLPATEGLEPGDVLAIGLDGNLAQSAHAYQPTVVGVYSSKPGFVGGVGINEEMIDKVPLAVVGVVPVKASAENGAIQPGDLLVASDTPGHAMRAGSNPPNGTIIGKALAGLDESSGVIQMLVILQ